MYVCGSIEINGVILFMKSVVLYLDFKLDESYTPSKISIRAGDGFHNLKVISLIWVIENALHSFHVIGTCST